MSDHYDTLGVGPDATPEEIKKAYRKACSEHHPDRGGSDEKMAAINKAYQVLSDPVARVQYDATGGQDEDSPEVQAIKLLNAMLEGMLEAETDDAQCPLDILKRTMEGVLRQKQQERDHHDRKLGRFKKRQRQMKEPKGKRNVLTALFNAKIGTQQGIVNQLNKQIEVTMKAMEIISGYTNPEATTVEAEEPIYRLMSDINRRYSGNFGGF